MRKLSYREALDAILAEDQRYTEDAYIFLREGLDYTVKNLKRRVNEENRHVSGAELLHGLRDMALEEYGPLALTVLRHWGIHACEDWGEIVFNLVDKGVLGKTENDSKSDFKPIYDFEEAFTKPFLPDRPRHTTSRAATRNTETKA